MCTRPVARGLCLDNKNDKACSSVYLTMKSTIVPSYTRKILVLLFMQCTCTVNFISVMHAHITRFQTCGAHLKQHCRQNCSGKDKIGGSTVEDRVLENCIFSESRDCAANLEIACVQSQGCVICMCNLYIYELSTLLKHLAVSDLLCSLEDGRHPASASIGSTLRFRRVSNAAY